MHVNGTVHAEPHESVEAPTYRVNFWEHEGAAGAWSLDAYVLSDVQDVTEALRWVESHAQGRHFEVFVESDDEPVHAYDKPRKAALVRLCGTNPNIGITVEIGRFVPV